MSDLSHDRVARLCEDLKLPGIPDAYAALAAAAGEQEQSFTDFLENTLTAERDFRRARSAATLIRMAGFPAELLSNLVSRRSSCGGLILV